MMAIRLKDGGPAFPQKEPLTSDHPGMTMRQWYAAHAPNAPEWFRLDVEDMPTKIPAVPENWDAAERAEFAMIKEGTLPPAAASDDVQVFWKRYEQARLRAEAWRQEMRQKKFFAWRWFYADMMLETEP
jgi:hypothetical protein